MSRPADEKVVRAAAYVPVTHEMLVDSGAHQCDETCPPPWSPPIIPASAKLKSRIRGIWWRVRRLPGYRLVHKDDIAGGWDE